MYLKRRKNVSAYLKKNELGAAVFIDSEEHREPSIRYLTGFAGDAVLIVYNNETSVLIPWD